MKGKNVLMIASAAAALGGAAYASRKSGVVQTKMREAATKWYPVASVPHDKGLTLNSQQLEPLSKLGEMVELRVLPDAQGDMEISARLVPDKLGKVSPLQAVMRLRSAIQRSRSLFMKGEIRPPKPSHILQNLASQTG